MQTTIPQEHCQIFGQSKKCDQKGRHQHRESGRVAFNMVSISQDATIYPKWMRTYENV